MSSIPDFAHIANQFVTFYYNTFDDKREQLKGLYRDSSMLTFEAAAIQGANAIVEKLVSLPFKTVKHQVSTIDAQPSSEHGSILVMVTGMLVVDEAYETPMRYTQAFNLVPEGQSNYFVLNDVFRMVFG